MKHFLSYSSLLRVALVAMLGMTSSCASYYVRATWGDPKLGTPTAIKPPYVGVISNVNYGIKISDDIWEERKRNDTILLPFLVLSLPFDIAFDTICLPYDIFSYFSDMSDQWFWERVFKENDTSLPLEKYSERLSTASEHHADRLLLEDRLGFRIVTKKETNQDGETVERKMHIPVPQGKISPEMRRLYQYVTQQRRQRQLREAQQEIEHYRKKKNHEAEVIHWERIRDRLLNELLATRNAEAPSPPEENTHPDRAVNQ